MIRPTRLRQGDVIRVIAPSGPVCRSEVEAGVGALGERYRLRFDESLFERHGFFAGSDDRRLAELEEALRDPDARAVLMARGGHGLLRLLPRMDSALIRTAARPLIGFSDGTALLAAAARAGVAAIHGPVLAQMGRIPESDMAALWRLLEDPEPGLLLDGLRPLVSGRVRGPLVGGNLEVFSRLLGTPFLPPLDGAILIVEDVGERPYRIDRLLTHLELAGVFNLMAGIVVGDFHGCVEPEATRADSPTTVQVLEERLGRFGIPVVFGAPVGHGARNRPLPYGTLVELDARAGSLHAIEGVVS